MEPSDGFEAFVAAYEAGSITGGAERLGIPRATLSRQLSRLEARLGVRLVHRDTRRFDPTEAGQELYERARRIVAESREALEAVRRNDDVPRGLLRVSVPPSSADPAFSLMLVEFARQWPEVRMEVHASSQHVDLKAGRFDVALRAGVLRDPDLIARVLVETHVALVAAPAYLARRGTPTHPDQLADHDLLVGFDGGIVPSRRWPLLDGGFVAIEGHLASNDIDLIKAAAIDAHGLAMLPALVCVDELRAGQLVPVLTDQVGLHSTLALVYPERAYLLPKVRAFVDHVVRWSASSALTDRLEAIAACRQGREHGGA